jgi:hypothetical protein
MKVQAQTDKLVVVKLDSKETGEVYILKEERNGYRVLYVAPNILKVYPDHLELELVSANGKRLKDKLYFNDWIIQSNALNRIVHPDKAKSKPQASETASRTDIDSVFQNTGSSKYVPLK